MAKCKEDRDHVRCVKDSGGTSTVHNLHETIAVYIPKMRCDNHPEYYDWVILLCDRRNQNRGMHLMPVLAQQMPEMLRSAASLGGVDIDHKVRKDWQTWRTLTAGAAFELADLIDLEIKKGA